MSLLSKPTGQVIWNRHRQPYITQARTMLAHLGCEKNVRWLGARQIRSFYKQAWSSWKLDTSLFWTLVGINVMQVQKNMQINTLYVVQWSVSAVNLHLLACWLWVSSLYTKTTKTAFKRLLSPRIYPPFHAAPECDLSSVTGRKHETLHTHVHKPKKGHAASATPCGEAW